ncbi:Oligopeptide transport ATP-binding protein OppF (TC 3.A.1.5.1) [Olavius algarvensis associated proteobacterium Delta 3]|nr:Oligopeptide transport ATP-binding protein OppF (TC 3.A.1.5.1) [Olavius algarvensis associated proteobacterium Delta 3]CAB5161239.1 Oligopeptide transport ATP-binding protein OppF (TC 3.A.1.5.1) [Olavius algarvensis associated proteobacterium Delta 3]
MEMEEHQNPIMRVTGLKKYFPVRRGFFQRTMGWVKAVDNVDMTIDTGKTLGLVGESGCGKSTVARLLLRLIDPDEGEIRFNGQDISRLSEKEMKPLRKEIQIVFQDPYGSLNPRMTVGQTIEEGLRTLGMNRDGKTRARIAELLEMVGLSPEFADRYPHEFSGGQRQRVGIARSLSVEPSLIICDEPVSALDVSIQAQIINLLKDLQDHLGLSYLFISHDLNVVGYLCDRVAVMYKGQIVEEAPSTVLFDNPRHPYTHTLLSAIPDPRPEAAGLLNIPENWEDMALEPPEGCGFSVICPDRTEACRKPDTRWVRVGDGHYVRCWKAN